MYICIVNVLITFIVGCPLATTVSSPVDQFVRSLFDIREYLYCCSAVYCIVGVKTDLLTHIAFALAQ